MNRGRIATNPRFICLTRNMIPFETPRRVGRKLDSKSLSKYEFKAVEARFFGYFHQQLQGV